MAKRFTDTDRWKHAWCRTLSSDAFKVWSYLNDQCDHAGIWIADFDLITFQCGITVNAEKLSNWFSPDKLLKVSADKFLLVEFFKQQYGKFNENNQVHRSANELLKQSVPAQYLPSTCPAHKDKEEDKDKDKYKFKDTDTDTEKDKEAVAISKRREVAKNHLRGLSKLIKGVSISGE